MKPATRNLLLLLLVVFACSTERTSSPPTVLYEDGNPFGISFARSLIASTDDSVRTFTKLFVRDAKYPVLTSINVTNNRIVLTSETGLHQGMTYDVVFPDYEHDVFSFTIPFEGERTVPSVKAVHNLCNQVPANLLKIYVEFSEPMSEGRAYQYCHLINSQTKDTVDQAFLELEPELWNDDRSVLTLWLDPGRIKQDLIPNKTLGTVLDFNTPYTLFISPGWKSQKGVATDSLYQRNFTTVVRDIWKPDVTEWIVTVPEKPNDKLRILLNELHDWSLMRSSISIWKGDDEVKGTIEVDECNRLFFLTPKEQWTPGEYQVRVDSRLEDFVGNNLNRLFETDVTNNATTNSQKEYVLSFVVR